MSFLRRRLRTSTIVLTGLFLAVFALWLQVRPPSQSADAGPVQPGAPAATHAPTRASSPSPTPRHTSHSPTPSASPSPSLGTSGPSPSPSAASPTASQPSAEPSGTPTQP